MIKHYVAVGIFLALAAGINWTILTRQAEAGRVTVPETIAEIPARIADYEQRGADIEVDEHTKRVLETSSILIRNYTAPNGWPIELTIVYAGSTRRSLHFPEVCLVGAGWEIRSQESTTVGFDHTARRLVLVNNEHQQAVLYWFKTGDFLTGNFFLNAMYWAKNQITFGTPTSAMIKLTAPLVPGNEEAAFAMLEDFAMKLQPVIMRHVP